MAQNALNSGYLEALTLQNRSNARCLIALHLDRPAFHSPATTAMLTNRFRDSLDHRDRQVSGEIVDNDHGLAPSMSRFLSKNNASELPDTG